MDFNDDDLPQVNLTVHDATAPPTASINSASANATSTNISPSKSKKRTRIIEEVEEVEEEQDGGDAKEEEKKQDSTERKSNINEQKDGGDLTEDGAINSASSSSSNTATSTAAPIICEECPLRCQRPPEGADPIPCTILAETLHANPKYVIHWKGWSNSIDSDDVTEQARGPWKKTYPEMVAEYERKKRERDEAVLKEAAEFQLIPKDDSETDDDEDDNAPAAADDSAAANPSPAKKRRLTKSSSLAPKSIVPRPEVAAEIHAFGRLLDAERKQATGWIPSLQSRIPAARQDSNEQLIRAMGEAAKRRNQAAAAASSSGPDLDISNETELASRRVASDIFLMNLAAKHVTKTKRGPRKKKNDTTSEDATTSATDATAAAASSSTSPSSSSSPAKPPRKRAAPKKKKSVDEEKEDEESRLAQRYPSSKHVPDDMEFLQLQEKMGWAKK